MAFFGFNLLLLLVCAAWNWLLPPLVLTSAAAAVGQALKRSWTGARLLLFAAAMTLAVEFCGALAAAFAALGCEYARLHGGSVWLYGVAGCLWCAASLQRWLRAGAATRIAAVTVLAAYALFSAEPALMVQPYGWILGLVRSALGNV